MFSIQTCHGSRWRKRSRLIPASSGFSLLEVLIASTVFSLGLAGFAALLLTSMTGSAQARREGIAATAAANLSEQIRANPAAVNRYLFPPASISMICAGDNQCSPEQQADYDFRLWQLDLADGIQNARGLVCRDETPSDGVEGDERCDGAGPLVIKIFWQGRVSDGVGESTHHRFTLEAN